MRESQRASEVLKSCGTKTYNIFAFAVKNLFACNIEEYEKTYKTDRFPLNYFIYFLVSIIKHLSFIYTGRYITN